MSFFWHPDMDDAPPSGDPRRCPWHPHVQTSSPDGLFDAPCGECEAAMEDDRAPFTPQGADLDWDNLEAILDPAEASRKQADKGSVVFRRMGHPVRATDWDDDIPF